MSANRAATLPRRLDEAGLRRWIDALRAAGRRVWAPVERDGLRRVVEIESAEQVCLAAGKPRWSPKEALFPRTETLFTYRRTADGVTLEPPAADPPEQVLFAVRPCDAAGLARLDAVFAGVDATYAARRARTTVVSLACAEAGPECFCTSVGGEPDGVRGSDAQLLPLAGGWLICPLGPKGEELVSPLAAVSPPASGEDVREAMERVAAAAEQMAGNPIAPQWAAALEASFGAPLWQALGRACLGCSICTYACPSCSCFDVGDSGTAECGARCRSWDSCTFDLFTRHAGGHDPRPTQAARFRQRVLHKFAYYPQAHGGELMCVGCGRCLTLCPVGLDVRAAVSAALAAPLVTPEELHARA